MGWKVLTNLSVGCFWRIENNPIGPHKRRTHGRNFPRRFRHFSDTSCFNQMQLGVVCWWMKSSWWLKNTLQFIFTAWNTRGIWNIKHRFQGCYSEILWPKDGSTKGVKHRFLKKNLYDFLPIFVALPCSFLQKIQVTSIWQPNNSELSPRDVNLNVKIHLSLLCKEIAPLEASWTKEATCPSGLLPGVRSGLEASHVPMKCIDLDVQRANCHRFSSKDGKGNTLLPLNSAMAVDVFFENMEVCKKRFKRSFPFW